MSARLSAKPKGAGYWLGLTKMDGVDVYIAKTNSGGTKVMSVDADFIEVTLETGIVTITGKDKSAALHQSKTTEQVHNKTMKEQIEVFAKRHELTLQMDDQSGKAGRTYKVDFNDMTHEESEWTAIQRYITHLGLVAYVDDKTLHVVAANSSSGGAKTINYKAPTAQSYASGDFMHLSLKHDMILAKGVKTTVKSWNSKKAKVITATEGGSGGGASVGGFSIYHPDLEQDQADKIAKSHNEMAASHELTCSLEISGDETITAQQKITLTGTQSQFDQSFFIISMSDEVSDTGYRQTFELKNKARGD